MANSSFIGVPTKGINHDSHNLNKDHTAYSFALNAVVSDYWHGNSGFLSNESSNKCSVKFPLGYQVVGFKEIVEQKRTIYFLHNPITGLSQIGDVMECEMQSGTDKIEQIYCKNCPEYKGTEVTPLEQQEEICSCQYRIIISSNCLNFNILYPVDIEYKLTNTTVQLYFTDAHNERRYIYFNYKDNDPSKELLLQDRFKVHLGTEAPPCEVPVYEDRLDCERIKVHPNYDSLCPEFIGFVNGGNLKAGVYQILVSFADAYGNPTTSYFPSSQIAPLFEDQITFQTNYETGKALHFKINNLSNSSIYRYYNIVIAQTIDSFTEFIHVATVPVTQKEYVYTGNEKTLKRLDPTEVMFKLPYYQSARGVTKANDYLFHVGVKEYPLLNLQPVANRIELGWQTIALKEGAYRDPRNTFFYRTYQRDEVYSFGIEFVFDNGRTTCAFHIPGREIEARDLIQVNNNDVQTDTSCEPLISCNRSTSPTSKNRWEVYNTATVTSTPHEYTEDCKKPKVWERGTFSYWESTERYPNIPEIWGELCGQCIRHHKFPDSCVTHIHDGLNDTKSFNENNYIFPIGVYIDSASVESSLDQAVTEGLITQKERDSIVGYRIVRGNRVGQKSVVAKGLIYNMLKDNSRAGQNINDLYFPNYPYNDLRVTTEDDFLDEIERAPSTMYTFHSPDVHFVNSGIGTTLKVETLEYGTSEGYFTHSECEAKQKLVSTFSYILSFGLGLAAAISATGEKTCKTIVKKADRRDSAPVVADGSTTGVWMTNIAGVNQNTDTYVTYDAETGLPSVAAGAEEHITTCKGEPFQVFNTHLVIVGLIGGLNQIVQRTILGIVEQGKVLETIRALIPYENLSAQYNSVGKYNNYLCAAEGNKVRTIEASSYLTPHVLKVDEPSAGPGSTFNTITINNWNRESSVYLKLNSLLSDPVVQDASKISIRNQFGTSLKVREVLDKRFNRSISSYYVGIKDNIPNQYGQICDIEYLQTTGCTFDINDLSDKFIFGGDTFINRFALKRKHPFFLRNNCKLPDGSDILYDELNNAGKVKYFYNTPEPLLARITGSGFSGIDFMSLLGALTSENDSNYDIQDNTFFHQRGLITIYSYGIPYFLVESDINVDYRTGQDVQGKGFYPHNTDLKNWLEEENVPIKTDNFYFYNKTYSKQNKENSICTSCILQPSDLIDDSTNYNRIIYSDNAKTENKEDNWLIFKANNYYDFDLSLGKLISADGIEAGKILVRLEKGSQLFNAYDTIQTSSTTIQVGTGGIFASRPQDLAITDLGYAGTQHRDILHTEFGHIWADAERGDVFNLATGGGGLEELTKNLMTSWFKEHLPFEIKKHFPSINVDNNLNGIGLHYGYDRRFKRILITKLDYKPLVEGLTYSNGKFFDNGNEVKLWNPKYFCNKSWTLSYNFFTKMWTSFHSYTPLFYIDHIDTFDSSINTLEVFGGQLTNQQKVYKHNATNKSYQVFYGKLEPFIVETSSKTDLGNNTINSIEYYNEAIRYHNDYDTYYNDNKTYNKVIIYNDRQTSGVLNLVPQNTNDLSQSFKYPFISQEGLNILVSNSENMWRFNDFYNTVINRNNNLPMFIYDCNHVNKKLNPLNITYNIPDANKELIKGRITNVRFIQDKESNYKFIHIFHKQNQRQSFR